MYRRATKSLCASNPHTRISDKSIKLWTRHLRLSMPKNIPKKAHIKSLKCIHILGDESGTIPLKNGQTIKQANPINEMKPIIIDIIGCSLETEIKNTGDRPVAPSKSHHKSDKHHSIGPLIFSNFTLSPMAMRPMMVIISTTSNQNHSFLPNHFFSLTHQKPLI